MASHSQSSFVPCTLEPPADGWEAVIAGANAGGLEQLHRLFYSRLFYFYGRRGYSQDAADLAMNALMATAKSIRRGEIKEPSRLPGYVRCVAMRCLAAAIETSVRSRTRECEITADIASRAQTPEQLAIQKQEAKIVTKVMGSIPSREREVLTRFYVKGETKEEICEQLRLTDDQFRNMKSRAKHRVTSMVQSAISRSGSGAGMRLQGNRAA